MIRCLLRILRRWKLQTEDLGTRQFIRSTDVLNWVTDLGPYYTDTQDVDCFFFAILCPRSHHWLNMHNWFLLRILYCIGIQSLSPGCCILTLSVSTNQRRRDRFKGNVLPVSSVLSMLHNKAKFARCQRRQLFMRWPLALWPIPHACICAVACAIRVLIQCSQSRRKAQRCKKLSGYIYKPYLLSTLKKKMKGVSQM